MNYLKIATPSVSFAATDVVEHFSAEKESLNYVLIAQERLTTSPIHGMEPMIFWGPIDWTKGGTLKPCLKYKRLNPDG